MTVTQRIEKFRSRHPITVVETEDPYIGRVYRCALEGLRVHPMRNGWWRHDAAEIVALLDQEYGGPFGTPRYECE